MKKSPLLLIGIITLLLTGCQTNDMTAENEALKQKIAQLEQQITELEQKNAEIMDDSTTSVSSGDTQTTDTASPNAASTDSNSNSYTMEELTTMVEEFVSRATSTTPDTEDPQYLEHYFTLKQEAKQIDNTLEIHENSLESQYRAGTLSREEFRLLDRELETLEDQIDTAEDRLEIIFGMDD